MSRQLVALLIEPSGALNCTFMPRYVLEHSFVIPECLLVRALADKGETPIALGPGEIGL